jgi:DNA-nicking Smr family endonuclease
MGRRPPRRLSEEDRALWESVTRDARRLDRRDGQPDQQPPQHGASDPAGPGSGSRRPPRDVGVAGRSATPPFPRNGVELPHRLPGPATPSPIATAWAERHPRPVGRPEAGIDRRTAERLRRGEREPDLRIDLHGMTAERARLALDRFVASALRHGARCVLVITGKGGRRPAGEDAPFMHPGTGVLRDAAPHWLRTGPHAPRIVGIFAAHQRHGGEGAFYLYLKKHRG